ncbi:MAG: ATP-binding protein [Deltaproteobacteria bacterium]
MDAQLSTYFAPEPDQAAAKIAFGWLLRLRWWAICCQITVALTVYFLFSVSYSLALLSLFILFQALSNLYFQYLIQIRQNIPLWLFGFVMIWDIFHLTLLLHYSGGPMNPFTFLYLIHVALAAVLMPRRWAWGLAILTIACYAVLFVLSDPASEEILKNVFRPICHDPPGAINTERMGMHLEGMWVAFSLTALFIVFFIGRIQQSLAAHHQMIQKLQQEKEKSEKLGSLATLAAGAAHELATPLSTIAVVANEMNYILKESCENAELGEDVRLIRGQVQQCREILMQLSLDAGHQAGEAVEKIALSEFLSTLLQEFDQKTGKRVDLEMQCPDLDLVIPVEIFLRTLRGILDNALKAAPDQKIRLCCKVEKDKAMLHIAVIDLGPGMDEETLARATEPFFTTRAAGRGMGLGLFLAQSVAERYGGGVTIRSPKGEGTTVTFSVALESVTPT